MKNSHPQLKSVIFDMDGTLIDTEAIGERSWEYAGDELGVEVPMDVVRSMVGRTLPDIHALVRDALPGVHAEALFERADFHYHRMIAAEPPPVKPGAREVLDFLANRGIPLGLATSSRREQVEDKLGRNGLRDYFSVVVAAEQVENGKPHPEIYEKAAVALGTTPAECLCVEDSGPGLCSAHASGAVTLFVPEHGEHSQEILGKADHVLSDLHQAIELLERLLS